MPSDESTTEVSPQRLTTSRFALKACPRIIIGVLLVAALYVTLQAAAPYQRERLVIKDIKAHGGIVGTRYSGPDWVPASLQNLTSLGDRVWCVDFQGANVPVPVLVQLQALTENEALGLADTQIKDADLQSLIGNTSLWRLELDGTKVTDAGLQHLSGMTDLRRLQLSRTQVTGSGFKHLHTMSRLRALILSRTPVTDSGLDQLRVMTSLGWLDLTETQITDDGLQYLESLTSLQELLLVDTKTTPEARAKLRQALPNCKILPEP